MAVTFDAARALGFAAATQHNLTSVVISGTDRVLYVWVGNRTSVANVVSVVLDPGGANEAALSLIESEGNVVNSDGMYVTLHRLINPPTGTFTVRVTITTSGRLTAGAISVNGAHQTTPERTLAKNLGTGATLSIAGIASNANDLVLVCINSRQGASAITHTEDAGQTARWDEVVTSGGGASSQHRSSGSTEPGAASVSVGYTLGSAQGAAMIAVSVQEAGGGGVTLVVADGLHGHTADSFGLTQANTLAVADALHAHAADSPSLTQASTLAVADALHAHAAESPSPAYTAVLAVLDALHAHTADNVTLSMPGALVVQDALHGHAADSLTLTQASQLLVQDALHGHTVDSPVLSIAFLLTVADAIHAHYAENPTLAEQAMLQVADALHAHYADSPTVTAPIIGAMATMIRGMRDIRSSSGMGSVRTRAELGAIETTASISEVN